MSDAKQSHTPEPTWRVLKDCRHYSNQGIITNGPFNSGIYADHHRIAVMEDFSDWQPEPQQDANASRIVACVNAMQGIEDPAQWREDVGALVEAVANEVDGLGQLACEMPATANRLRAALDKVRGEGE